MMCISSGTVQVHPFLGTAARFFSAVVVTLLPRARGASTSTIGEVTTLRHPRISGQAKGSWTDVGQCGGCLMGCT